MSTRSMIGIDTPEGGRYIYCHSDGYPTWTGNMLRAIIDRDGAEQTVKNLFEHGPGGWSYLQADIGDEKPSIGHGETIPGYGVAYRDVPNPEFHGLAEVLADGWIEYVYCIRPDGAIDVYECGDGQAWRWRLAPGARFESDERPMLTTLVTLTTQIAISEEAGA